MGTGFKHGSGGGAPLNFKVVGGTTAHSNAKENTIWINTSTAITIYVFSETQPTNPVAGMVWIITGTLSSVAFSATKKNPVMVYPLSAKQYIGGAWVDKTAKSWQNGAWVDWITILMEGSYLNPKYGSWRSVEQGGVGGSVAYTDEGIELTANAFSGGKGGGAFVGPKDAIDFSTINTITAKCTGSGTAVITVTDNASSWWQNVVARSDEGLSNNEVEVVLDVTELSGNHYLYVGNDNLTSSKVTTIYKKIEFK